MFQNPLSSHQAPTSNPQRVTVTTICYSPQSQRGDVITSSMQLFSPYLSIHSLSSLPFCVYKSIYIKKRPHLTSHHRPLNIHLSSPIGVLPTPPAPSPLDHCNLPLPSLSPLIPHLGKSVREREVEVGRLERETGIGCFLL